MGVKISTVMMMGLLVIAAAGYVELNIDDVVVLTESNFALKELRKLSDSTIYSTLTIANIISAYKDDGIFHDNVILNLELSSPHFESGLATERFEVFVMTHKEDGVKSFAIDEFPIMDESAIEEFTNLHVARKRKSSEESFRRLELDALNIMRGGQQHTYSTEGGQGSTNVKDLLDTYTSESVTALRMKNSLAIQPQLSATYLMEEHELSDLSLGGLYEITVGQGIGGRPIEEVSDFHKYRARQLLDAVMAHLQSA